MTLDDRGRVSKRWAYSLCDSHQCLDNAGCDLLEIWADHILDAKTLAEVLR